MSTDSKNPSDLFGGTWEEWGQGKVPVGVDTADNDFNEAGKTGGYKDITLTAAQSGLKSHNHGFTGKAVISKENNVNHTHTISGGDHSHLQNENIWANVSGYSYAPTAGSGKYYFTLAAKYTESASHTHTVENNSTNHTHSVTADGTIGNNTATNATVAHSNLQPYITCYMFKRIS